MDPILIPAEMAAVDAAASEPIEELIERAGWAVARAAIGMLGGTYGRRVAVFAGKGNNGADGRSAARHLERRGVVCELLAPDGSPHHRPDLAIDGCVGTGLNRPFTPPITGSVPVLAIDIPSGINGLTGEVMGGAVSADVTVTFAALKPGLLFGAGREHAGLVEVADIGLDVGTPSAWLMTEHDQEAWPDRSSADHKWKRAVWVIGGQPGMSGAPSLAGEAAARAGSGFVAISTPGGRASGHREAVAIELPESGWGHVVAQQLARYHALVIGPGLDPAHDPAELATLLHRGVPAVVDAGALDLVASDPEVVRDHQVVLTPHEGEFERLTGKLPGPNRLAAARRAAADLGVVVLLKGPTTVVAHPDGQARFVISGDARLATAGTGDVLAGIIGAGLAGGLSPFDAAALGADAHGRWAQRSGHRFILASDLLSPS